MFVEVDPRTVKQRRVEEGLYEQYELFKKKVKGSSGVIFGAFDTQLYFKTVLDITGYKNKRMIAVNECLVCSLCQIKLKMCEFNSFVFFACWFYLFILDGDEGPV